MEQQETNRELVELLGFQHFLEWSHEQIGSTLYFQVRERLQSASTETLISLFLLLEQLPIRAGGEDRLIRSFFIWPAGTRKRFPCAWIRMIWFDRRIGLAAFDERIAAARAREAEGEQRERTRKGRNIYGQ